MKRDHDSPSFSLRQFMAVIVRDANLPINLDRLLMTGYSKSGIELCRGRSITRGVCLVGHGDFSQKPGGHDEGE
jgi:hypothetical protein